MNRRNVVRLAMAAALFGAAIPGAAMAQVIQAKYWTPKAQVQVQVHSQRWQDRFQRDMFEGRWVAQDRFDSNGDEWNGNGRFGDGWGGNGRFGDGWGGNGRFGDGWGGNGRFGDGRFGGGYGGGRMFFLPNVLNIDQGRRMIRVADRNDDLIQLITLDNGFHPTRGGILMLDGDLYGNRLVANGEGPRGQQIRQVMVLRDRGNTLIVRTQMQRFNGRVVELEKVYQRA